MKFYQPVYEWKFYEKPVSAESTESEVSLDGNINPTHEFAGAGTYRVVLTVIDYYGQTNSIEKTVEITASETVAPVTETNTDNGSSLWGTIFGIVFWIIIIVVAVLAGLGIFAFIMFKKNYPGHSFSDFMEYIQMTIAGEEYGPAPSAVLSKNIALPKAPQTNVQPVVKPTPVAPVIKPVQVEKKETPTPKIEPVLNTEKGKMPDWLKPKNETKVDEKK